MGLRTSATVVVAAVDSINKDKADLVCTGVNDNLQITAAIALLPAFGGKILLLGGNYNFTSVVAINKNNTIIEGVGVSTRIFSNSASFTFFQATSLLGFKNMCMDTTNNGVAISGLLTYVYNCKFIGFYYAIQNTNNEAKIYSNNITNGTLSGSVGINNAGLKVNIYQNIISCGIPSANKGIVNTGGQSTIQNNIIYEPDGGLAISDTSGNSRVLFNQCKSLANIQVGTSVKYLTGTDWNSIIT